MESAKTNGKGSNQAVDDGERYQRSNGEHKIAKSEETTE